MKEQRAYIHYPALSLPLLFVNLLADLQPKSSKNGKHPGPLFIVDSASGSDQKEASGGAQPSKLGISSFFSLQLLELDPMRQKKSEEDRGKNRDR
jgi:hypothetical protein